MKIERKHVVPDSRLRVKVGHVLPLDPHLLLVQKVQRHSLGGTSVEIRTRPRLIDGINLVRVRVESGDEYECYYCDVLRRCELDLT